MPFPFRDLCTLFTRLEEIELNGPALLPADHAKKVQSTTDSWFKSHRYKLNALTAEGAVGLLSALLPERRTDRVFGIQATSLCRILSRCLHLRTDRAKDLRAYTQPGHGDLGACLERVLAAGGPPAAPEVSLEEVDELFVTLAGHSRFSDPTIPQAPPGSSEARDNLLGNVFKRVTPNEGKWLVRLVLKDLSPLRLDEQLMLKSVHFLLPDLLRFQQSFEAAVSLLKGPLLEYPERPDPRSERLLRKQAAELIRPCVGVKVGRPTFHKARSIDHCLKMLGDKKWVLERKYDGEYCEIHVDLSKSPKPEECIKIFSKSGKDSTLDRRGIHSTLVRCLRLGRPGCKIKKQAILLGELIVWSDTKQEPLPFEKIRKFVTRSGVSIGTDNDSQRNPDEHLAIAFFDILLLDDEVIMTKPIEERRNWLREVYIKIEGRAIGAQWKVVDFADTERSPRALLQQFAASNAARCEGLVLKPCGMPYFALHSGVDGFRSGFIKLKKDYIAEMGDEADLAVVGASYDAQQALKSGAQNLKYTDFHLGALINKEEVRRFDARPRFKFIGTIQQAMCVPKPILQTVNIVGALSAVPHTPGQQPANFDLDIPVSIRPGFVFIKPLVFEVLGSGFEKASNADYFMLRHARVKKLHQDRSWKDCVSFQELQAQAAATREASTDSDSQETRRWLEKLEKKCKKKFEGETSTSPKSCRAARHGGVASRSGRSMQSSKTRQPLGVLSSNSAVTKSTPSRRDRSSISDLEGSTLIELPTPGTKRHRAEAENTPCPATKRQKSISKEPVNPLPTPTGGETDHPAAKFPAPADRTTNAKPPTLARKVLNTLSSHLPWPLSAKPTDPKTLHFAACSTPTCLFHAAVVYLAPCVASAPYVSDDLQRAHHIKLVPSLTHWDRASHAHPLLTDTVAESQSYPGQRKLVVVESRREHAVERVVQQVLALNTGQLRERVEVWDWRALECALRESSDGTVLRRWFVGATIWDEGRERAVFVWANGS